MIWSKSAVPDTEEACRDASGLLGHMPLDEFNATIRETTVHRFEQALGTDPARSLFALDRLESALESGLIPPDAVDVFDGTHLRRLADMHRKSGRTGVEVVADGLSRGSTIRVRDLDRFDGGVGAFAAATSRLLQAGVQCNLYLTPAGHEGFPPHFDTTDVFVAQCAGSKQWDIFDDYTAMTVLPLADANWDPERFRPIGEPARLLLQAADVLYLPRGVMHAARTVGEASLHLTFSVAPQTVFDLLVRALRDLASENVALRRRVPLGSGGALEGTDAEALRRWLIVASERADFPRLASASVQAPIGNEGASHPGYGRLARALAEGRTQD
jgi:hypothetical protein